MKILLIPQLFLPDSHKSKWRLLLLKPAFGSALYWTFSEIQHQNLKSGSDYTIFFFVCYDSQCVRLHDFDSYNIVYYNTSGVKAGDNL